MTPAPKSHDSLAALIVGSAMLVLLSVLVAIGAGAYYYTVAGL